MPISQSKEESSSKYSEKEWEQCLETVEKFEDRLDGLRRYGFTLITGLLSADALIGQVSGTQISTPVKLATIASTGLLILALWVLDRDYQLYQRSASERARTIERGLGFSLQRKIEYVYRTERMWRYIHVLYWLFVLATISLAMVVVVGESFWLLALLIPGLGLWYFWTIEPRVRFFAYGSDMNSDQMKKRIGRGIVGEHATLRGYELKFNKQSRSNPKAGFANIVSKSDDEVQGVLYNIRESDLWKLDRFEDYPYHYGREELDVVRDNGERIEAQVYSANEKRLNDELRPSDDYLKIIREADPKVSDENRESWNEYKQRLEWIAKGQTEIGWIGDSKRQSDPD